MTEDDLKPTPLPDRCPECGKLEPDCRRWSICFDWDYHREHEDVKAWCLHVVDENEYLREQLDKQARKLPEQLAAEAECCALIAEQYADESLLQSCRIEEARGIDYASGGIAENIRKRRDHYLAKENPCSKTT